MSQQGNTLPRRDALPPANGTPKYITGEVAQDLCRLTGLSLDDGGKFLDVSRLPFWDYFRVLWAFVGGNYYALKNPWPPVQCLGCSKEWPLVENSHGYPLHTAQDEIGGIVGCTKELQ